jgi:LEA14-like dessication related protein
MSTGTKHFPPLSHFLGSLVAIALFAVALTGCVKKPTVQLDSAQIAGVGLVGVSMNIVVKVNNTNSFDVMVREVNAQVTINNRYTLSPIVMAPNVWLASDKTTLVTLPLVIPWTVVPGLLSETLGKETISYRVQGTADVTATKLLQIQKNNHPINEEGTVSRAALLSAARVRMPMLY